MLLPGSVVRPSPIHGSGGLAPGREHRLAAGQRPRHGPGLSLGQAAQRPPPARAGRAASGRPMTPEPAGLLQAANTAAPAEPALPAGPALQALVPQAVQQRGSAAARRQARGRGGRGRHGPGDVPCLTRSSARTWCHPEALRQPRGAVGLARWPVLDPTGAHAVAEKTSAPAAPGA